MKIRKKWMYVGIIIQPYAAKGKYIGKYISKMNETTLDKRI